MALEGAFYPCFYSCFQNAGIIRVYVVVSACCFTSEPTLPFVSGYCSGTPNGPVLYLTLYTIPFNCSFIGRLLGFLISDFKRLQHRLP